MDGELGLELLVLPQMSGEVNSCLSVCVHAHESIYLLLSLCCIALYLRIRVELVLLLYGFLC